jgi:NADH dehydrogenase
LGGGFAGLSAAKALSKSPVKITLVDRENHHLFQPLLYQVATAGLSEAEIAQPIRHILSDQKNLTTVLNEVDKIDLPSNVVSLKDREISYDYLIIALGLKTSYFGNDSWGKYAPRFEKSF